MGPRAALASCDQEQWLREEIGVCKFQVPLLLLAAMLIGTAQERGGGTMTTTRRTTDEQQHLEMGLEIACSVSGRYVVGEIDSELEGEESHNGVLDNNKGHSKVIIVGLLSPNESENHLTFHSTTI